MKKTLCFTEGIKNCKWHWTFYLTGIWIIRAKIQKKRNLLFWIFFFKFKIYWCLRVGCFISEHFDILTSQLASIALLISWTFIIQINIIAWSYTIKRWYLLNWWNYQFMFMFTHQNLLLCTLIHTCSQRFWYATSDLSYIKKLLYVNIS